MSRTAFKIAENVPGHIAFSLQKPAGLGDPCSATAADFSDLDASCQIISASLPVAQNVTRGEVPGTWCDPTPESSVTSVSDEFSAAISVLMDESVATGVAKFLFEHSGESAWLYMGTQGDDPPKAYAHVRLVAPELFGAPGEIRQVQMTFPVDGKPAVCFGDKNASAAVWDDPNDVSAQHAAAAAMASLSALKADGTLGDNNYSGPAFTTGTYIKLGDGTTAHYATDAWSAGPAS